MQDEGYTVLTAKDDVQVAAKHVELPSDEKEALSPRLKPKKDGRGRANKKGSAAEWTPWKDRIRSHKDAVLFITTCLMPLSQKKPHDSNTSNTSGESFVRCLLSASAEGTVRVFELARFQPRQKLALQPPPDSQKHVGLFGRPAARGLGGITAFAYQGALADEPLAEGCDNLPVLYGAYESGRLVAWNAVNGALVADLPGHTGPVTTMQCRTDADGSKSGRPCIVSASLDGSIRVWRAIDASALLALGATGGASNLGEFGLQQQATEPAAETVDRIRNMIETVFDALKENRLKGADEQKGLTTVLSFAREFGGSETMISRLEMALSRPFIARNAADCTALLDMEELMAHKLDELHAVVQRQMAHEEHAHDDVFGCMFVLEFGSLNPVSDFQFVSSHHLLASSWDGRLRCLNLKERTCTNSVEVRSCMKLTCHCTVPSSQQNAMEDVYVGMQDGNIARWNLMHSSSSPSNELSRWQAHAAAVTKLHFVNYTGKHSGATRRWLVSTSEDGTLCIWSPEKGELLKEFYGHTGGVLQLCYTPQERLFWSGSRDHSVRSWCLETAENQIRELESMATAEVDSRRYENAISKAQLAARMAGKNKNSKSRKSGGDKANLKSPKGDKKSGGASAKSPKGSPRKSSADKSRRQ